MKHYWGNQNDPHSPPPFPLTTYEKGSRIRSTVRRGIRKPSFQPSYQKRACSRTKISSTLLNTRLETIERITCHCFLRPLYQERPYEQLLHNWIFPTRRARFQIIFNAITQDTFCYKYRQCEYSHRGTWKRLSNNNDFWKTDQYIHKSWKLFPERSGKLERF